MPATMPRRVPWVIAYDGSPAHGHPPYSFECRRCRATLVFSVPLSVNLFVATGRAFLREHRRCR
jgi:hypothetical protein